MQQLLTGDATFSRPDRGGLAEKSWRFKTSACLLVIFTLVFLARPNQAFSQVQQISAEQVSGIHIGALQPETSLSKFEARRIRHRCRDQVADPNAGKELNHCFEMHIAARRLFSECKRKTKVSNLSGHEREEAVRRCVIEKGGESKQSHP